MKSIFQLILLFAFLFNGGLFAQQRPNIIFLLTDDQTSIATRCYDNPQVKTPNMDKLAEQGVQFMNHYNSTAICMASRACIMTGMYEYKHACNFMHGPLHPDKFAASYPVLLRHAGYFTGFAGKFGFAVSNGESWDENSWDVIPVDSFDVWGGGTGQTSYQTAQNKYMAKYAEEYPHSTRSYGAWAADFLKAAKQSGKPFCMSISFKAPHLPFTPDKYFDAVYAGTTYQKPANYGAENATHLSPQAKSGRQYKSYNFWRESEALYQEAIRKYNQLIYGVDFTIGKIRESLEKEGLAENTIIIFTGDNGYSCGAHNFGGKVLPYEEASKSPLIIYDPHLPESQRGKKRETLTANIDMAPTILSYAGLKIPKNMDGENLIPLINKENGIKRKSITLTNMWGNDEIQEMAVVTKDWKYIFWQYEDQRMQPVEELFHVGNDRLEMKNLATETQYAAQLKHMRKLYKKHYKTMVNDLAPYNNYQQYKIFFNPKSKAEDKKPYLQGTFEEMEAARLKARELKKKNRE